MQLCDDLHPGLITESLLMCVFWVFSDNLLTSSFLHNSHTGAKTQEVKNNPCHGVLLHLCAHPCPHQRPPGASPSRHCAWSRSNGPGGGSAGSVKTGQSGRYSSSSASYHCKHALYMNPGHSSISLSMPRTCSLSMPHILICKFFHHAS